MATQQQADVPALSLTERLALFSIADGADIYDRALAGVLRDIERKYPRLIHIGRPQMYQVDGTDQMPYFGAIATAAGRAACKLVEDDVEA